MTTIKNAYQVIPVGKSTNQFYQVVFVYSDGEVEFMSKPYKFETAANKELTNVKQMAGVS